MQINSKALILFLVIFLMFTLGIIKLFALRFESGDIYPPYSSLRADPLGTKGIFDSLENLGTVSVTRNYRPEPKIKEAQGTTLLYLGLAQVYGDNLPESTFKRLDRFVRSGGRLVITFFPTRPGTHGYNEDKLKKGEMDEPEEKKGPEKVCKPDDQDKMKPDKIRKKTNNEYALKKVSMAEEWGFVCETKDSNQKEIAVPPDKTDNRSAERFASVSWHSNMRFARLSDSWETIYYVSDKPVVIEKKCGRGSIVFSSDSYFISNEALKKEPHPALLAWLAGENSRIIFDESHLGIKKSPGIMMLIRKYNLHGLVVSLLLLAVLFVWKNASCLVPPIEYTPQRESDILLSARDHSSGLSSLLKKNIGAKNLINMCITEWCKTIIVDNEASKKYAEKLKKIKSLTNKKDGKSMGDENPVKKYARICRIISERE